MSNKMILICDNCSGHMEIDREQNIAKCPLCGSSKILFEGNEDVIERIKDKTFQDIASEKMQANQEIELTKRQISEQEENEKKLAKIRKSPLTIGLAILTVASLFSTVDVYRDKYIISAIIMGIQTMLFFFAWLIRMCFVKGAKLHLHSIFTVLALLLMIPFLAFIGKVHRTYDPYVWPDSKLTAMLPKPQSDRGSIEKDTADQFSMDVANVTEADYNSYIEECKEKGFTIKPSLVEYEYTAYTAYNDKGAELRVSFFPHLNEMEIHLDAYEEFYEFVWSGRGLAALIPEPVSKLGIINAEQEDNFRITVAENADGVNLYITYNVSNVMEITVYTN